MYYKSITCDFITMVGNGTGLDIVSECYTGCFTFFAHFLIKSARITK